MAGPDASRKPPSLLAAGALTGLAAGFFVVMGVGSAVTNRSALGLGIAAVLVSWGAILALGAWGMMRARRWSRGIVVAGGLLHLASFAGFVANQPWAIVPAALALLTVVAAIVPSTTAALHLEEPSD